MMMSMTMATVNIRLKPKWCWWWPHWKSDSMIYFPKNSIVQTKISPSTMIWNIFPPSICFPPFFCSSSPGNSFVVLQRIIWQIIWLHFKIPLPIVGRRWQVVWAVSLTKDHGLGDPGWHHGPADASSVWDSLAAKVSSVDVPSWARLQEVSVHVISSHVHLILLAMWRMGCKSTTSISLPRTTSWCQMSFSHLITG